MQQQQPLTVQLRPLDGEQSVRQLMLLNIACLPINYGTNPRATHYKNVARNRLATNGTNSGGDECGDPNFWTMMAYHHHQCQQQQHANDGGGSAASPLLVGAITASAHPLNSTENNTNNNMGKNDGDNNNKTKKDNNSNGCCSSCHVTVQLLTLAVLPVFRRRGVASQLLHALIRQCEEWANVEKIFLHCQTSNEAALCLYRAHGFAIVQQIPGHYRCRRREMIGDDESELAAADAFLLERRIMMEETPEINEA